MAFAGSPIPEVGGKFAVCILYLLVPVYDVYPVGEIIQYLTKKRPFPPEGIFRDAFFETEHLFSKCPPDRHSKPFHPILEDVVGCPEPHHLNSGFLSYAS